MKKFLFGLVLVLSLSGTAEAQDKYDFKTLVGSWRNADGAGLDVVDTNTVYVVFGDNRKKVNYCKADFSKSPVWLDLAVKDTSSKLVTLKSLLLFVSEDMIQWQVFDKETRPAHFSNDKGNLLFLKRVTAMNN